MYMYKGIKNRKSDISVEVFVGESDDTTQMI